MGLGCSSVEKQLISTHKVLSLTPELPLKRGVVHMHTEGRCEGQEEPDGAGVNILIHFCSIKEWKIQEIKNF